MKALHPLDSPTALTTENRSHAFRLTVAGLVSRTQQFSLQDLRFNFNERCFDSRKTDRFSADQKLWRGCSLNELIEFVGVSGQAIMSSSSVRNLVLSELFRFRLLGLCGKRSDWFGSEMENLSQSKKVAHCWCWFPDWKGIKVCRGYLGSIS
jgi:hypothetical protein